MDSTELFRTLTAGRTYLHFDCGDMRIALKQDTPTARVFTAYAKTADGKIFELARIKKEPNKWELYRVDPQDGIPEFLGYASPELRMTEDVARALFWVMLLTKPKALAAGNAPQLREARA